MIFNIFLRLLVLLMFMVLSLPYLIAQIPKGVPQPHENEPVGINSLSEVIIYIVLPVGLIILYIFWRKRINRKKSEAEEKEKDNSTE